MIEKYVKGNNNSWGQNYGVAPVMQSFFPGNPLQQQNRHYDLGNAASAYAVNENLSEVRVQAEFGQPNEVEYLPPRPGSDSLNATLEHLFGGDDIIDTLVDRIFPGVLPARSAHRGSGSVEELRNRVESGILQLDEVDRLFNGVFPAGQGDWSPGSIRELWATIREGALPYIPATH